MSQPKKSLTGLTAAEITAAVGLKERYRGRQIFEWIIKGVRSFEEMKNLPAQLREQLETSFTLMSSTVEVSSSADDNTAKIAVRLNDGRLIEAVLLRDENDRATACLSCQIGCAMGCTFCRTGRMGLKRNLSSEEIVEQYFHLRSLYGEISNIVYMGMGEPFRNTDEVIRSVKFFTGADGLGMSERRITISTCGVVEGINKLSRENLQVRLAVSVVTADPVMRSEIMPVTKTNSLTDLKAALLNYQKHRGRRITLECAVIRGINDSSAAAAQLADWADGLNVNVNVIPWNPASEIDFQEPDPAGLEAFCRTLERKKIPNTRRFKRGRGLNAACGQLATELEKDG